MILVGFFLFFFPCSDKNRLVAATSFDYLDSEFGIAISSEQFRGVVAVQTRVLQKLWFNKGG